MRNYFGILAIFLCIVIINGQRTWSGNFANMKSWNIQRSYLDENRAIVNDPKGGSDKVLRVKYPKGSYTGSNKGGTGFYIIPFDSSFKPQYAVLEYQVLFPKGFNFVKGGKLPGLFGGDYGCSGGSSATNCFSGRFMWKEGGTGIVYLYANKNAKQHSEICNLNSAKSCSPEYGLDLGKGNYFTTDKWITIKEEIRLNTQSSQQNGLLRAWTDGQKRIDTSKVLYLTQASYIWGVQFETFFGGSSSSWATPTEQYSYFKNIKITAS